jgi:hypothetical protein
VVDRTNFKSRSKLLFEEIAAAARPARPPGGRALASDHATRPHRPNNATEVDYDSLAI